MSTVTWKRARLTGTLTVTSPLHIGDGHMEIKPTQEEGQDILESTICQDIKGNPYIPASSLRGAIKALIDPKSEQIKRLFGYSGHGEEGGQMGALRCYDATSTSAIDPEKDSIARTRINQYLGTAYSNHLFNFKVVPAGFTFYIQFELDDISEPDMACLLAAIQRLDQSGNGLGRGKRTGQGRLNWQLDNLEIMDTEQLTAWVSSEQATPLWKSLKHFPKPDFQHCISLAKESIHFTIEFISPWLINSPELVSKEKSSKDNKIPKLEFSRRLNRALLPASSLKGWLRHRAIRILQTLLEDLPNSTHIAETWVNQIFGSTHAASWLTISDALSASVVEGNVHSFNAVDRFTGGVKDTALYFVRAAPPCDVKGKFGVTSFQQDDWRLGLLLLVLRDAMEGDLVLGWGKAKGFGQAKLSLQIANHNVISWQDALSVPNANLHAPIKALSQKIQDEQRTQTQEVNHA